MKFQLIVQDIIYGLRLTLLTGKIRMLGGNHHGEMKVLKATKKGKTESPHKAANVVLKKARYKIGNSTRKLSQQFASQVQKRFMKSEGQRPVRWQKTLLILNSGKLVIDPLYFGLLCLSREASARSALTLIVTFKLLPCLCCSWYLQRFNFFF